jgi:hypothetical protein
LKCKIKEVDAGMELALLSDRGYGGVPDACVAAVLVRYPKPKWFSQMIMACVEGLAIPRFMAGIVVVDFGSYILHFRFEI